MLYVTIVCMGSLSLDFFGVWLLLLLFTDFFAFQFLSRRTFLPEFAGCSFLKNVVAYSTGFFGASCGTGDSWSGSGATSSFGLKDVKRGFSFSSLDLRGLGCLPEDFVSVTCLIVCNSFMLCESTTIGFLSVSSSLILWFDLEAVKVANEEWLLNNFFWDEA